MNWVKTLNDMDKVFYDKCADISISALYETEEVIDKIMLTFQTGAINFIKDKNATSKELEDEMIKHVEPLTLVYTKNHQKMIELFDDYSEKATKILRTESNSQNINIIEKRVMLSNKKCGDILNNTMKELVQLHKSLIADCIKFIGSYFFINKEDSVENENENIINNIDESFEKTKIKYNKIFKQRDIVKYLEQNGFTYKNTGRHANFSDGVNTIPVPMHSSKELGYGLQRKIQKEVMEHKNML
jgi:predicted RNA binding protein YcfA (HicA-like mRNA interferase family)